MGILGVKLQNMKMHFNTGGTWRRVGQCKLIMKIYDIFFQLSQLDALYNNIKNYREDGRFFTYYYVLLDNDLAE